MCVQAFKRMRASLATKAMQPILLGQEVFPGPAAQSGAHILEIGDIAPSWHASSTCKSVYFKLRTIGRGMSFLPLKM